MPIPSLTDDGLLPEGIHDCSIDEIKSAFGWFGSSGRRYRLFQKLVEYLELVRGADLVVEIIVDGSFVTSAADPGDIDLLVATRERTQPEPLQPIEYLPSPRVAYADDLTSTFWWPPEGSNEYRRHVEFFTQVKGRPGALKGLLRVRP